MRVVAVVFLLAAIVASAGAVAQEEQVKITIDVRDADIGAAVSLVFEKSGQSYVMSKDAKGTVTAHVVDQPVDVALRAILSPLNLTWRKTNGIYIIVRKQIPVPTTDDDMRTPRREDEKDPEPVRVEKISLNFIDGHELVSTLKGEPQMWDSITDRGRFGILPLPNEPGILMFPRADGQTVPRNIVPVPQDRPVAPIPEERGWRGRPLW